MVLAFSDHLFSSPPYHSFQGCSPLEWRRTYPAIYRRSCPNKQKSALQIYVLSALSFVSI